MNDVTDDSIWLPFAFFAAIIAFVAGVFVGDCHGEDLGARKACGICDDHHKANECGLYVCTQEGWR